MYSGPLDARAVRPSYRLLLLAFTLALPACTTTYEPEHAGTAPAIPVRPSTTPIAMTFSQIDGSPLELASLRGRAVLIIAFVMDDLNSQALLRNAERVVSAHPDDVAVIALSGDRHVASQQQPLGEAFMRAVDLHRTHLVVADEATRDGQSPLGTIERTPTVFFVNRAGVIVRRLEGYFTRAQLEELVAPALPPR